MKKVIRVGIFMTRVSVDCEIAFTSQSDDYDENHALKLE